MSPAIVLGSRANKESRLEFKPFGSIFPHTPNLKHAGRDSYDKVVFFGMKKARVATDEKIKPGPGHYEMRSRAFGTEGTRTSLHSKLGPVILKNK